MDETFRRDLTVSSSEGSSSAPEILLAPAIAVPMATSRAIFRSLGMSS